MGNHPVGNQLNAYFAWLDTLQLDPGHTRDTFQRPDQLTHQQVVSAGQIPFARYAHPQDRLVGKIEFEHVDTPDIRWQRTTDRFHPFTCFHRFYRDVFTPVKNNLDIGAGRR